MISSDRDTVYKNFIKHKIFISSDRDTVTPRYQNLIRPAKDTNLIRTKGKSGYRLNLVLLFTYFQLAFIDYFLSKLLFINLVFLLIVDGVNI